MSTLGPQFDDIESLAKNSYIGQANRMRRDAEIPVDVHGAYVKAMKKAKVCPHCTYLARGKKDLSEHTRLNHP